MEAAADALCRRAGVKSDAHPLTRAVLVGSCPQHIVLAEHPISDATAAELAGKADALYGELVRQLTSNAPTSAARERLRQAEPSALCLAGA